MGQGLGRGWAGQGGGSGCPDPACPSDLGLAASPRTPLRAPGTSGTPQGRDRGEERAGAQMEPPELSGAPRGAEEPWQPRRAGPGGTGAKELREWGTG